MSWAINREQRKAIQLWTLATHQHRPARPAMICQRHGAGPALNPGDQSLASPALLNRSSLLMYTCRLLTALCLVRFISSLIGTPRSLLDVT